MCRLFWLARGGFRADYVIDKPCDIVLGWRRCPDKGPYTTCVPYAYGICLEGISEWEWRG